VKPLPTLRAAQLAAAPSSAPSWLIEGLWSAQAVGIIGGEPKCCKSFLALDLAVAVASGTPCLRCFPAGQRGPVLLFAAEDDALVVRRR
jgi:RecA-family ATPase